MNVETRLKKLPQETSILAFRDFYILFISQEP